MQTFRDQQVDKGECPLTLGPKEWEYSFRFTQNVTLQDLEFINCKIGGSGLATYGAPIHRSTARNLRLRNCGIHSFFGGGAVFDDVVVNGLRTTRSPVTLDGCVLRHVVLAGKCGRFIFNRDVCHDDPARNAAFRAANAAFYEDMDWALDITSLRAVSIEIRGSIPSRLIRRNPDRHFIMTRTVAQDGGWRSYEPYNSFATAISLFLESGVDDNLFAASASPKRFKEEAEYYHRLKSAGLMT